MFRESLVIDVWGPAKLVDAGVVDQDVHGSRLGGQLSDVVGAVEICGDETCFATNVCDITYGLGPAFGAASVYHDLGAVFSELERYFAANP